MKNNIRSEIEGNMNEVKESFDENMKSIRKEIQELKALFNK